MKRGKLYVTVECSNCGVHEYGLPLGTSGNRCAECGRFAKKPEDYCCVQHNIKNSPYPSGRCPRCEQEQQRRDMIQHEMTRDPQVEPW